MSQFNQGIFFNSVAYKDNKKIVNKAYNVE